MFSGGVPGWLGGGSLAQGSCSGYGESFCPLAICCPGGVVLPRGDLFGFGVVRFAWGQLVGLKGDLLALAAYFTGGATRWPWGDSLAWGEAVWFVGDFFALGGGF